LQLLLLSVVAIPQAWVVVIVEVENDAAAAMHIIVWVTVIGRPFRRIMLCVLRLVVVKEEEEVVVVVVAVIAGVVLARTADRRFR